MTSEAFSSGTSFSSSLQPSASRSAAKLRLKINKKCSLRTIRTPLEVIGGHILSEKMESSWAYLD